MPKKDILGLPKSKDVWGFNKGINKLYESKTLAKQGLRLPKIDPGFHGKWW